MIKEIAFSSYRVTDMAKARQFYEGALGLTPALVHRDMWVEYEIAGGTFALQTMTPDLPSGHRGLVAFEVDDLETTLMDLKGKGIAIAGEVIESPVCRMAQVHDPDGNPIMLHKRKS